MNAIDKLFTTKKEGILSIYFTAGYPVLDDMPVILRSLEENGVDLVEIGMPFSDPMADGPVIRESNNKAIRNGMHIKLLFKQLSAVKDARIPKILMGYLNPVMQYGIENFCRDCRATGVSGVIIPDLPYEYYLEHYKKLFREYGLYNILLVAPETPVSRISEIDAHSEGFLYVVSTRGVTGMKAGLTGENDRLRAIAEMPLRLPLMIGFGISNKASFEAASHYARGGIIGTSFIKVLSEQGSMEENIQKFVISLRESQNPLK